jgi:hypothetical protein
LGRPSKGDGGDWGGKSYFSFLANGLAMGFDGSDSLAAWMDSADLILLPPIYFACH